MLNFIINTWLFAIFIKIFIVPTILKTNNIFNNWLKVRHVNLIDRRPIQIFSRFYVDTTNLYLSKLE